MFSTSVSSDVRHLCYISHHPDFDIAAARQLAGSTVDPKDTNPVQSSCLTLQAQTTILRPKGNRRLDRPHTTYRRDTAKATGSIETALVSRTGSAGSLFELLEMCAVPEVYKCLHKSFCFATPTPWVQSLSYVSSLGHLLLILLDSFLEAWDYAHRTRIWSSPFSSWGSLIYRYDYAALLEFQVNDM